MPGLDRKRKGYWKKTEAKKPHTLVSLPEPPPMWTKHLEAHRTIYMRVTVVPSSSQSVTTHCVVISDDGTWSVSLHGLEVTPSQCAPLSGIPRVLDSSRVNTLLRILNEYKICAGNPDQVFIPLAKARKGVFKGQNGVTITARQDTQYPVEGENGTIVGTIRSEGCQLLICQGVQTRCQNCNAHQNSLRKMLSRSTKGKEKSLAPDSHVNLRYLNTPEKQQKHQQMKAGITSAQRESSRLLATINALQQQSTVELDSSMSEDMLQIVSKDAMFPEGSPMRLLWEQQKQALSAQSTKGMRWHPLIIKWRLSLRLKSPAAYRTLTESGFLVLPSERTLRDYTHYINALTGYNDEVDVHLAEASRLKDTPPYQRCVILAIDEMHIKEDLVFNKHSGRLIGFVNLGDADTALSSMNDVETKSPTVANHMLVVMIQFLFKNLNFVYAVFPTVGAAGYEIYSIIWEAISRLEMFLGLKVCILCEQCLHGCYTHIGNILFVYVYRYLALPVIVPHPIGSSIACVVQP